MFACAALLAVTATPAAAQGIFGDIKRAAEQAVKRETTRKTDETITQATRCAMGDSRCQAETSSTASSNGSQGGSSVDPGGDHPLVTPYAGSVRNDRKFEAYTDYRRIIGVHKQRHVITEMLEGKLTSIVYNNPKERSTLEIIRNYQQALAARGFRIDYQMSGGETWVDNARRINGMIQYGQDVR
ncbi:hypothetical protein GCM10010990_31500 [Croceicoccus mobilis]|uniref:Uncharacterized protein n=2 Tax=Croceicoccus mobilis TaxID=1703339 RepID=A0A916Z6Z4_9SPHN|nr:hypothetical protein GCM10010990_31500 [Croceicoccus mobilis]